MQNLWNNARNKKFTEILPDTELSGLFPSKYKFTGLLQDKTKHIALVPCKK